MGRRKTADLVYVLRVTLETQECPLMEASAKNHKIAKTGAPWRELAIHSSSNLYDLAKAVINAFHFDFDHAFGFFSTDGNFTFDAECKYELFTDMPDVEPTGAGSVKETNIRDVWQKKGDTMYMLFDYGDMWWFTLELQDIYPPQKNKKNPRVVKKQGASPQQYGY